MKNLRNIFAILLLSVAFYSCDADATLDEVEQAEYNETHNADTGDQNNEVDERD